MSKVKAVPTRRLTVEEIRRILRAHLPALRERYRVKSLGLFGSYVRCEQRESSGLGVLVEFDDCPFTLFEFVALENYLSDLLWIKLDLVEKHGLEPAIGRRILKEVVPV